MRKTRTVLTFAVLALFLGACATTTTTATNEGVAGGTAARGNVDHYIAGIVATANEGEIQQGTAAASRATNADVRAFARMLVTDHTTALQNVRDTASRAGITVQESDVTATLRSSSQQTVTNLGTYTGAAFDRRFVQAQVDLHQWLLNQLDTTLIPQTQNAQLRSLLQTQRASVANHLQRATELRGRL